MYRTDQGLYKVQHEHEDRDKKVDDERQKPEQKAEDRVENLGNDVHLLLGGLLLHALTIPHQR
jgi:hypothetical protein